MDDFGDFCYLDVQKTGSTFVTKVLKEVSQRPLRASVKHGVIETPFHRQLLRVIRRPRWGAFSGGMFRDGCFYFNSVRDPFEYYPSLYNYGCDRRGGVYNRLQSQGYGHFYDGAQSSFLEWMAFILDEGNAQHVNPVYAATCAPGVGFFTYRFLALSVAAPSITLRGINTTADAEAVLERHNISRATLRNETLNADLLTLLESHLAEHVDLDRARELLTVDDRVNASVSKSANGDALRASSLAQTVRARDALLFRKFYPET